MRTSLKEHSPHLVDEWSEENYPLTPEKITYGSNKKVLWKGKCGHKWSASIKNRVNGAGCPYCSNNAVLKGFNDLESLYPKVAKEWSKKNFPLKASMVTPFSNRKVWWECEKGHEWFSLISSRTDGSGCPYCVGTVLERHVNDFKTQYPDIALEWSVKNTSLSPDEISPKSRRNVWWTCKTCGYEWKAVVNARVKGGGCPVCSNRKVLVGYNDLATTDKHPIFAVMVGTGLRVGELTGLRWCDIDLDEGIIDVNHTLIYYSHRTHDSKQGCYFNVNTPKTQAGNRQVPMLDFVKEAFLIEKERQEMFNLKCQSTIDGYTDFIFINRFGQVQHQGTLNKAIKRIIRDCNDEQLQKNKEDVVLLPNFSCHSLRHTFATRLCESGMNIKVIQDTLGHRDITTTLNIYTDVTKDLKMSEFEGLDKCFGSMI